MPTVVIVHAAEDAPPARALAEKLSSLGLSPIIGQSGEPLRNAMRSAASVVALWSPRSTASEDVVAEVSHARTLGSVIHARMQNAVTPPEFGADQGFDLTGWRGEDDFAPWRALAQAITNAAGVAAPAPRPAASPFFQPGQTTAPASRQAAPVAAAPRPVRQDPPPLRAVDSGYDAPRPAPPRYEAPPPAIEEESSGGGRLLVIGVITFLVVAVLGGGGYFAFTQMQGGQASAAAWGNVDQQDPAAIRAFLADNPGSFRDDAEAQLSELDDDMWQAARSVDSIDTLQAYLAAFPNGEHVLQARGRIAELNAAPGEEIPATQEEIDPLTGMPYAPEDLVPPDSNAAPGAPLTPAPQPQPQPEEPTTGGPVQLTPVTPAPEPEELPTN